MDMNPEIWTSPAEVIPAEKCTVATQTVEATSGFPDKTHSGRKSAHAKQRRCKRVVAIDRESRSRECVKIIEASVKQKFGQGLSHPELLVIARFVSQQNGNPIDRDATRRKASLLSWCAENMEDFLSVLAQTSGKHCPSDYTFESATSSDAE